MGDSQNSHILYRVYEHECHYCTILHIMNQFKRRMRHTKNGYIRLNVHIDYTYWAIWSLFDATTVSYIFLYAAVVSLLDVFHSTLFLTISLHPFLLLCHTLFVRCVRVCVCIIYSKRRANLSRHSERNSRFLLNAYRICCDNVRF